MDRPLDECEDDEIEITPGCQTVSLLSPKLRCNLPNTSHLTHSFGQDHHERHQEAVNHPQHYGGANNPHEHVKCMEAIGLTNNAFLYNTCKYIWRCGKKTNALEDLRKAAWYLDREIKRLERIEAKNEFDPAPRGNHE